MKISSLFTNTLRTHDLPDNERFSPNERRLGFSQPKVRLLAVTSGDRHDTSGRSAVPRQISPTSNNTEFADGPKATAGSLKNTIKTIGDVLMSAVPGSRRQKAKETLKETLRPICRRASELLIKLPEIAISFHAFQKSQDPRIKGGDSDLRAIASSFDLFGMKNNYSQNVELPGELGEMKKLLPEARRKKFGREEDNRYEDLLRDIAPWGNPTAYQNQTYVSDSTEFKNKMTDLNKNLLEWSVMTNALSLHIFGKDAPIIDIP